MSLRLTGATAAAAVVGAVVGAAVLGLSRPDPPACTTLDDGVRACMPILVVAPPWWAYATFAVIGALLAGGVAYGCLLARRARDQSPGARSPR